jgi:hypothetical protein
MRISFEAPILLMESYHVNIPIDRNKEASKRFFQDFKKSKTIPSFFLRMKIETIKSITPPKVMLIDESRIGVIWIDE